MAKNHFGLANGVQLAIIAMFVEYLFIQSASHHEILISICVSK